MMRQPPSLPPTSRRQKRLPTVQHKSIANSPQNLASNQMQRQTCKQMLLPSSRLQLLIPLSLLRGAGGQIPPPPVQDGQMSADRTRPRSAPPMVQVLPAVISPVAADDRQTAQLPA